MSERPLRVGVACFSTFGGSGVIAMIGKSRLGSATPGVPERAKTRRAAAATDAPEKFLDKFLEPGSRLASAILFFSTFSGPAATIQAATRQEYEWTTVLGTTTVSSAGITGQTPLFSGRKAFQRPTSEGVRLLNAIQDVYLNRDITVA